MKRHPVIPPRKITRNDRALVCYALLDESVSYTAGHGLFFVEGKEIGKVPCLAICQDKDTRLFTLYYCNKNWKLLGVVTDCCRAAIQNPKSRLRLIGSCPTLLLRGSFRLSLCFFSRDPGHQD